MAAEVFLIRHGQSTFNASYEVTGSDPFHFDAPLSPLGHRQVAVARAEAQRLAPDLAVVSPLSRAIETGLGLFDPTLTRMIVSPLHSEQVDHSCDVGRPPAVLAVEFPTLAFGHLGDPWWYHLDPDVRGVPREPDEVANRRVRDFAVWLDQRPEPRVVVIGHGVFFNKLIGRHLQNCEIHRFR